MIDYDHASHSLTATLPGGGIVTLTAPGGVTIEGDVTVNGEVTITGNAKINGTTTAGVDVIGAGISLVKHTHTGNLGAPTSPPL
ncbi:hypothetical protein D3C76_1472990 [compost metagenome]